MRSTKNEGEQKGKWIVVTGLDGSGKTTFKNRLVGYLKEKEHSVKDFKAPHDKHLLSLLDVSGGGLPLVDNYTDQLIFTLDNRMLSYYIQEWRSHFDYLISQRGFIDSFVHGQVRGYNYREVDMLQKTSELEKCQVMIHFNADPKVAFDRIKNDPDADKFETLEYIEEQARSTRRAYNELMEKNNESLSSFNDVFNIYIDTTKLSCDETFDILIQQLEESRII